MSNDDRERWNARYERGTHASTTPSPFLVAAAEHLPRSGRALDVAGGCGRNGLWLARQGLDVTIVDISAVGLAIASERAAASQLSVSTVERDLGEDGLPPGPWDVIVSVLYLERSLLAQVPRVLAPGGIFAMLQPTTTNLERHDKPPRSFLLEPGELEGLVQGLEILSLDESWSADGFHEARLIATQRQLGQG